MGSALGCLHADDDGEGSWWERRRGSKVSENNGRETKEEFYKSWVHNQERLPEGLMVLLRYFDFFVCLHSCGHSR